MTESYRSDYPASAQMNLQAETTARASVANQARPKVANNGKIYWVFGALAATVLLIGGLFVTVGLGVYFYSLKGKTLSAEKYRQPQATPDYREKSSPTSADPNSQSRFISQESLREFYRSKNRAGRFELLKVFENRATGFFLKADSEAGAIYGSSKKNEDVMIEIGAYSSKEMARTEFADTIKAEKKAGTRMISELKEDGQSITATFQSKKLYVLTFCRLSNDSFSPCYRLSSFNRFALADFYRSFFEK